MRPPETRSAAAFLAAGILVLLGGLGCVGPRPFSPETLPAELRAPPVLTMGSLNLSRLGGPTATSDRIDRGDVLEISLAAGLEADAMATFSVRVGEDGTAVLPEIGLFQLAGLGLMDAEQQIAAACLHRGLYRQPLVTVTMKQPRVNRVTVVGAVEEPGVYELPRASSSLLAAIVAAGGLTDEAGTRVEIRQPPAARMLASGGPAVTEPSGVRAASNVEALLEEPAQMVCLNLADAASQTGGGVHLHDGSTVKIEKRQPEPVQVIGLVKRPGQFDYPVNHDLRLLGAIAQAEGLSSVFADKVLVIRNRPDGQGFARIRASLRSAKRHPEQNLRLAPGDIVSVEQTPATAVGDTLKIVIGRFTFGAGVPLF